VRSEHVDAASPYWDGHLLLLHRSEEHRVADVTAWVRRGLERDEKVLYVEPDSVSPSPFMMTLLEHGLDVTAAERDGRLSIVPMTEWYPVSGRWAVIERALAEGFPSVRVSGEARTALALHPWDTLAGFERQMDDLVRSRPVHAMCQYSVAETTGARLADTVAMHLDGVRQEIFDTRAAKRGLRLRGELDRSNTEVLAEVLRAACATVRKGSAEAPGMLVLDLAGVDHMDAAASRQLAAETAGLRSDDGQLVLLGPQPTVTRVLHYLEIDSLPGVRMIGGR
jgi:anti-anti-sigma factor